MSRLPMSTAVSIAVAAVWPGVRSMWWAAAMLRSFTATGRRLARPSRRRASTNSISRGCPPMVRVTSRRSARVESAQGGQAVEQPPQFGHTQRGQGDADQGRDVAGDGVAAGDEDPPGGGEVAQRGEDGGEAGIGEVCAVAGEVLFEVVEDDNQTFLLEQPGDQAEFGGVLDRRVPELRDRTGQARRPRDGIGDGGDEVLGLPPSIVDGDRPALLGAGGW